MAAPRPFSFGAPITPPRAPVATPVSDLTPRTVRGPSRFQSGLESGQTTVPNPLDQLELLFSTTTPPSLHHQQPQHITPPYQGFNFPFSFDQSSDLLGSLSSSISETSPSIPPTTSPTPQHDVIISSLTNLCRILIQTTNSTERTITNLREDIAVLRQEVATSKDEVRATIMELSDPNHALSITNVARYEADVREAIRNNFHAEKFLEEIDGGVPSVIAALNEFHHYGLSEGDQQKLALVASFCDTVKDEFSRCRSNLSGLIRGVLYQLFPTLLSLHFTARGPTQTAEQRAAKARSKKHKGPSGLPTPSTPSPPSTPSTPPTPSTSSGTQSPSSAPPSSSSPLPSSISPDRAIAGSFLNDIQSALNALAYGPHRFKFDDIIEITVTHWTQAEEQPSLSNQAWAATALHYYLKGVKVGAKIGGAIGGTAGNNSNNNGNGSSVYNQRKVFQSYLEKYGRMGPNRLHPQPPTTTTTTQQQQQHTPVSPEHTHDPMGQQASGADQE